MELGAQATASHHTTRTCRAENPQHAHMLDAREHAPLRAWFWGLSNSATFHRLPKPQSHFRLPERAARMMTHPGNPGASEHSPKKLLETHPGSVAVLSCWLSALRPTLEIIPRAGGDAYWAFLNLKSGVIISAMILLGISAS